MSPPMWAKLPPPDDSDTSSSEEEDNCQSPEFVITQTRRFKNISSRLRRLGCLPITEIPKLRNDPFGPTDPDLDGPHDNDDRANAFKRLVRVCQKLYGKSDGMLNYEYRSGDLRDEILCELKIIHPNGAARSYQSPPQTKRSKALKAASRVALANGALDFLKRCPDPRLIITKIQEPEPVTVNETPTEGPIHDIERACLARSLKPEWITMPGQKSLQKKYGCALVVKLSRDYAWSVEEKYENVLLAKEAVANEAVQDGLLDIIGSESPSSSGQNAVVTEAPKEPSERAEPVSLQSYYDALPEGLRKNFDLSGSDLARQPVHWLHTLCQGIQGMKSPIFLPVGGSPAYHGCLVRLEKDDERSRSFYVGPIFKKKKEAKLAVCLLAAWHGYQHRLAKPPMNVNLNARIHSRSEYSYGANRSIKDSSMPRLQTGQANMNYDKPNYNAEIEDGEVPESSYPGMQYSMSNDPSAVYSGSPTLYSVSSGRTPPHRIEASFNGKRPREGDIDYPPYGRNESRDYPRYGRGPGYGDDGNRNQMYGNNSRQNPPPSKRRRTDVKTATGAPKGGKGPNDPPPDENRTKNEPAPDPSKIPDITALFKHCRRVSRGPLPQFSKDHAGLYITFEGHRYQDKEGANTVQGDWIGWNELSKLVLDHLVGAETVTAQ